MWTNFTGALLMVTNFTNAFWSFTTCPDGTVTSTGC